MTYRDKGDVTLHVGLHITFSTVDDALDAPLDLRATEGHPPEVIEAVDFG